MATRKKSNIMTHTIEYCLAILAIISVRNPAIKSYGP